MAEAKAGTEVDLESLGMGMNKEGMSTHKAKPRMDLQRMEGSMGTVASEVDRFALLAVLSLNRWTRVKSGSAQ